MRSVGVDTNVQSTKRLTELNQRANNELKEVKGKTAFNGHGFSEKEASKTNEHANGRRLELLQAQCGPLRQNQQPIGPVVQWERFLPVRSLKVLLVENDDSTRQLVSALLRNCSYEVTAVANGLEAWKILADLTKHIDLVLTEVVMPYLSGVGLLSKIMNNISCKNIPVIMMSSDDSMGIVFNCLSKGAVDFLVKPIRKNELKNLWQHVWRKCHSVNNNSYSNLSIGLQLQSSGSGSESGIWTQKYMKSRSIEGSDNEAGSDDEGDSGSISLTSKDGSDNGSDTQSFWPKRAAEVNSSKAISHWHQLPDPLNSTCGQVLHTRLEAISDYQEPTPASREECVREDDKFDTLAMGKDLAIGVSRDTDLQLVGPSKNETGNMNKERLSEPSSKRVSNGIRKGTLELICETAGGELRTEAADLVGNITKTANNRIESAVVVVPNEVSNIANIKERDNGYAKELPVLELSLKRVRDAEDTETRDQQRNVLRQSNFSAFSRYHTATNSNPAPTGNVGSCSPLDNSSEAVKGESTQYLNANSKENRNQQSNGSSNNDDMGSTTNNAFSKPEKLPDDNQIPKSIVSIHPSFALQGAHEDHTSSLQPVIPDTADVEMVDSVSAQPKSTAAHQQVQVRHHHHYHHHHHHHHVHNMQQQKQMSKQNGEESLRNTASNVINGSTEGNAANYGSASGSNNNRSSGENGSSGKQGSPSDAVAEGAKIGSDTGVTGKCETGDVTGSRSGSGVDQSRLTLREAALQKFREKRKQRCFEKKVRYQSRKKLAEQRPRVRGQFVRQGVQENKNEEANS